MAHSKTWRKRDFCVKSLKALFNLRFKTEQPSIILQESLHLSDKDPPLLLISTKENHGKTSSELEGYGWELAAALTASIQPFIRAAISIIPVIVDQEETDLDIAAKAAVQKARKTYPDGRLIMTAAKCQSIERAACIALGLGAYMAGQRDVNKSTEREIQMEGLRDLKAHRDEICETFETLGSILRVMKNDDEAPGRIFCQTGSSTVTDKGIMFFGSNRNSAQILCGTSTKDKLSEDKSLAVVAFDDHPESIVPHEGVEIAVILREEAKAFQAFAEAIALFQSKEVWIITNATGTEWLSPESPVHIRHEERAVQAPVQAPVHMPESDSPKPSTSTEWGQATDELRLVLVGRTGSGKSSTGNTILGKESFDASASAKSITNKCKMDQAHRFGRHISVVDTPGLFDTTLSVDTTIREISRCIGMTAPGPHAFILVLTTGRFTAEIEDTVTKFTDIFGDKCLHHTIIVFTKLEDIVDETLDDFVERSPPGLHKLITETESRYIGFNNKASPEVQEEQARKLLQMAEKSKASEDPCFFTNDLFEEFEHCIKRQTESRRKKLEKDAEEMEKRLHELEDEWQQKQKEYTTEIEKLEQRLRELEKYPGSSENPLSSIEKLRKEQEEIKEASLKEREQISKEKSEIEKKRNELSTEDRKIREVIVDGLQKSDPKRGVLKKGFAKVKAKFRKFLG